MLCLDAFRLFQAYFRWFYSFIQSISAVLIFAIVVDYFIYFILHTVQTLWIFSECLPNMLNFFRVFDKHAEFFQSVWQTCWIFSECLLWRKFPFLLFALYYYNYFRLKKKLIEGPVQATTQYIINQHEDDDSYQFDCGCYRHGYAQQ